MTRPRKKSRRKRGFELGFFRSRGGRLTTRPTRRSTEESEEKSKGREKTEGMGEIEEKEQKKTIMSAMMMRVVASRTFRIVSRINISPFLSVRLSDCLLACLPACLSVCLSLCLCFLLFMSVPQIPYRIVINISPFLSVGSPVRLSV